MGWGLGGHLAWCSNLSGFSATGALSLGWRLAAESEVVRWLAPGGEGFGKRYVTSLWHDHDNCRGQAGTALAGCVEGGDLFLSFLRLLHSVFNSLPEI